MDLEVSVFGSRRSESGLAIPGDTTIFHVTHWKAGSQWIRGVLEDAFADRTVAAESFETQVLVQPIQAGKIYTCVYVSRQEFNAIRLPGKSHRMVVIRDLRDTLVSGYFSLLYSHTVNPSVQKLRPVLATLNGEEGLLYLMEAWLAGSALIQRSWLEAGEPVVQLESFMSSPVETWERAFNLWGIGVAREKIERLLQKHAFTNYTKGRSPGQEDIQSHYRKGVAGDWRQYFTPRVSERFKVLYGDLLVLAGYERDSSWVCPGEAAL